MKRILGLVLAAAFGCSIAMAGSIDPDIAKFRKKMVENYQDRDAYDEFIAALKKEGLLGEGNMEKFIKAADRAVDPKGLEGDLINKDGMEATHMLGMAIYGEGYDEEGYYLLENYKNTRKYTPEQGLKAAQKVYEDFTGEKAPEVKRGKPAPRDPEYKDYYE